MAYSRVVRIGNGSTNQFVLDFALGYLNEDEITCRVGDEADGSGDPIYRDLTFLSDTLVEVSGDVPGNGVQIVFDRTVEKEDTVVHFSDGDVLDEFNLDISFKQILMSVHEVLDGRFGTFDQDIDMGSFQIKNVGEPTDASDATTKQYVDAIIPSNQTLVAEAEAARDSAQSSASAASSSATSAASSASAASTSQSSAASSAVAASTLAAAASTSATNAQNSATAAAASETNAGTSATSASSYASAAQSYASAASTSATSAGSSATDASNSASAASVSASNAATSETNAENAWNSFNDIYLGEYASDPTEDNDGDALQTGVLYWNTVNDILRVFNGTNWVDASAQVSRNVYEYTSADNQTVFDGADRHGNVLATGNKFVNVYVNGLRLTATDDYAYTTTSLTFSAGLNVGDEVLVEAISTFEIEDTVRVVPQTLTDNEKSIARNNIDAGFMSGFRNKIINGDFTIAQRATSHTFSGSGIYVADRWHLNLGSGASLTMTQEEFALGDDTIPSVPTHYIRLDRTVVGSASCSLTQKIEGLAQFSGKTVTQTFWARASSAMTLFSFFQKNYGTGGSPTSAANIHNTAFSITTSWQKFTRTLVVDDLTGDILGTDGNDFLEMFFAWNTSNNAVGQLEFAHVSVVEGDATEEDDPFEPRSMTSEELLCYRYYQKSLIDEFYQLPSSSGAQVQKQTITFPTMRAAPTLSTTSNAGTATLGLASTVANGFRIGFTGSQYSYVQYSWTVDAEL